MPMSHKSLPIYEVTSQNTNAKQIQIIIYQEK